MKVLHVVHGYRPESEGGVESYLARLLPEQRRRGLDARVLAGSMQPWPRCGVEPGEHEGVPLTRLHRDDFFFDWHGKAWHPGVEAAFAAVLASERPDLVHVHHWIRLTANLVEVAHAAGVPAVLTLHDVYTSCPRAFRVDRAGASCSRPLSAASCTWCVPRYGHESDEELAEGIELFAAHTRSEVLRAAAVLTGDEAPAAFLARALDVPPARLEVLPLPHAPRLPARRPPVDLAAGEPLRLCHFGRLSPHKGIWQLLDAFAGLCRETLPRPVELHVFGTSEVDFERELRQRAAGRPVFVHGAYTLPDLAAMRLHCAVFPSLAFETFGLVLDEAFELGLPVVVSDLGALGRRAAAAGVRVPPGDVPALQAALVGLATEPARLRELAANIPPPPPSLDTHARRLEAIYAAARAAPLRQDVVGVDPRRRAAFVVRQRESALLRAASGRGPV